METPDVPGALAMLNPAATEGRLQLDQASYFLSKIELQRGNEPTLAPWRKRLFIATSYIAADAAEQFALPRDRTGHHGRAHRGIDNDSRGTINFQADGRGNGFGFGFGADGNGHCR